MSDDLQIHLSAKDDLTRELKNTIKTIAKLEAALREATESTSPDAERDVERLTRQLTKAQGETKSLSAAIDGLDRNIDQMGGSARRAASAVDEVGSKSKAGRTNVTAFATSLKGAGVAAAAAAVAVAGAALAVKKVVDVTLAGVKAAAAWETSQVKIKQVFGKQLPVMRKWAKRHAADFGVSTNEVLTYSSSVQDLLIPMGFARDQATGMTQDIMGLVPALVAWDEQGRSAAEITHILTSAIMGEREALKSLGISIRQEHLDDHVELLKSQGKLVGMTKQQAYAYATLDMEIRGSSDAIATFNKNQGTIARKLAAVSSEIATLKDQGLGILAEGIHEIMRALFPAGGQKQKSPLQSFAKWVRENRYELVAGVVSIAQGIVTFAQSLITATAAIGDAMPALVRARIISDPSLWFNAEKRTELTEWADGIGVQADKWQDNADALQAYIDKLSTQNEKLRNLQTILDGIQSKKVQVEVVRKYRTTGSIVPYDPNSAWFNQKDDKKKGDTRSPIGFGSLGAGGLAAAHARYSAALGGHSITSGLRFDALGSSHSDHRYGRAMDIHGPRMNAYANEVRRAGGYAAFHGQGSDRHLHVVPQRHGSRELAMAGGDTFHADVTVVNPRGEMDVQTAVSRGLRSAARDRRERGGRNG